MNTWPPRRVIVPVDDSSAALAAVRTAVGISVSTGAALRVVHVLGDGQLERALGTGAPEARLRERRTRSAETLLRHVEQVARAQGVDAECECLAGEAAQLVLAEARSWQADLVVIGRAHVTGPGHTYVGTVTRHVLEFSDVPVLVVPRPE